MHRAAREGRWGGTLVFGAIVVFAHAGCAVEAGESAEAGDDDSSESAWHGDCDASDRAGKLVEKAERNTMFDAELSWRQTNDAGQGIAAACNLATHKVTNEGMLNVPLHCGGGSQAQKGYARVGARWGTSRGAPSCAENYCAAIYVRDRGGALREVARDIYLRDRFFCSQSSDRTDERLDVDACTYSDVVRVLKQGESNRGDDQSNLTFNNGKLAGYSAKGLTLKYRMYPCGNGPGGGNNSNDSPPTKSPPSGGSCGDKPTPEGFSCAQQKGWGKCDEAWMKSGGYCKSTCGRCGTAGGGCGDKPTPEGHSCAQQKAWGKCGASWMTEGGFCKATCGRC